MYIAGVNGCRSGWIVVSLLTFYFLLYLIFLPLRHSDSAYYSLHVAVCHLSNASSILHTYYLLLTYCLALSTYPFLFVFSRVRGHATF
jgi:hypothetical protein